LQRNKRCVSSCKKKFTCNTPFCNCNCCVASCKKSRTTLYFSQRCETSCLLVTSPQQLATQFCQNGPMRAHLSLAGDFRHLVCYCTRCKLRKKLQTCDTPSATWKIFYSSSLRCKLQEKIAPCNMAFRLIYKRAGTLLDDRRCAQYICPIMVKLKQNPGYFTCTPVVIWPFRPITKSAYMYFCVFNFQVLRNCSRRWMPLTIQQWSLRFMLRFRLFSNSRFRNLW